MKLPELVKWLKPYALAERVIYGQEKINELYTQYEIISNKNII